MESPASRFSRFRGCVDSIGGGQVSGWAFDATSPNRALRVEILYQGQPVGSALADAFRADLLTAGLGDGRHGFTYTLPRKLSERLPPGAIEVVVEGTTEPLRVSSSARAAKAAPVPAPLIPLPGTPLVDSPFFEARLAAAQLPERVQAMARFYRENGYLVLDFEFPDFERVAARVIAQLTPHYDDVRVQDAWSFNADVRAVALHAPILELLRQLYGREPFAFQTLNFRVGSQQPLHSDAIHFNSMPERFMCGVWVAFEDVDDTNGPLVYVPGSHRLPIYKYDELGVVGSEAPKHYESAHFEQLWERLPEACGLERKTFRPRRGQALIWAANLLHGGAKQRDAKRTRHSQVTHYYFESCAYWTPLSSDPFLGRVAYRTPMNIATGRPMRNVYANRDIPAAVTDALHPQNGAS